MVLSARNPSTQNILSALTAETQKSTNLQNELEKRSLTILDSKVNLDKEINTNQELVKTVVVLIISNLIILSGFILLSFIKNSWAIFGSVLGIILLIVFNYEKVSESVLKVLEEENFKK